ncbi:hypothetical protein O9G_002166 [Rozella allomycis CSF55]|uniref:Uncharacterized protein n=1 Tax=Rozella allomycis (strain CSF55) TaxID=988480 RepID=A0A075AQ96_ROZAC|nr:hypothetical protein O9G_002166 [Rozella allomycis CSF55]|eukprot:EPZ32325.1 hypothetical protein O9G_002166 [Rozella allomycis CSF55]
MWFSYFTVAVRGIVSVMNLVFPGAKMMDGVCMYGWDVDVLTTFVVIDMLVDIIVTTVTIQSLRQYLNDAKQYLSNVGAPIQVAVIKSSVIRSFMILIVNIVMILAIFHRLLSQHGLTVCLSTCAIYQLLIITERGLVETLRKRSFQLSSHAGPSQVKARIGATATLT